MINPYRCPRCDTVLNNNGMGWLTCIGCRQYEMDLSGTNILIKLKGLCGQSISVSMRMDEGTSKIYHLEKDYKNWKLCCTINQIFPTNITFDRVKKLINYL